MSEDSIKILLTDIKESVSLPQKIKNGAICFVREKKCPICPEQLKIIESIKGRNIFLLDIDASDANKKFSKTLDLEIVPSFLFIKNGEALAVKDPDAKSNFLMAGLQSKGVLEKIFSIIEKYNDPFELIIGKNCIACRFCKICLIHKLSHRKHCLFYWRAKAFDLYS